MQDLSKAKVDKFNPKKSRFDSWLAHRSNYKGQDAPWRMPPEAQCGITGIWNIEKIPSHGEEEHDIEVLKKYMLRTWTLELWSMPIYCLISLREFKISFPCLYIILEAFWHIQYSKFQRLCMKLKNIFCSVPHLISCLNYPVSNRDQLALEMTC